MAVSSKSRSVRDAKTALGKIVERAYSFPGFFSPDTRMGNAFVRAGDNLIAVTPSGNKIGAADGRCSIVDVRTGNSVNGIKQSSECKMYLEILKVAPDTTAGIHLHGCYSMPLIGTLGAGALDPGAFAEANYYFISERDPKFRSVRGKSGSAELARSVAKEFSKNADVVFIFGENGEYHGSVAISNNKESFIAGMESLWKLLDVEYMAKVEIISALCGRMNISDKRRQKRGR